MKGLIVDKDIAAVKVAEILKKFSRLILKLYRPEFLASEHTKYQFRRINHPTENKRVMLFDESELVPFNLKDTQGDYKPRSLPLIEEVVSLLYPNATDTKKEQIRNFVKNNAGATVEEILPNTLPIGIEIKTESQLTADGWFNL